MDTKTVTHRSCIPPNPSCRELRSTITSELSLLRLTFTTITVSSELLLAFLATAWAAPPQFSDPGTSCPVSWQLASGPNQQNPGQGDAHQNYYMGKSIGMMRDERRLTTFSVQLSDNVDCGGGQDCSVGKSQSQSMSISSSLGTDSNFKPGGGKGPRGILSWFDGGFDVSQEIETGNDYMCTGDGDKKAVCIWSRIAHTAVSCGRCF